MWLSLQAPLKGTGKLYSKCKEEPFEATGSFHLRAAHVRQGLVSDAC